MIIRYIYWGRTFDDRFMDKYMPEAAAITASLHREELERECQKLKKRKWDTKTLGKFRGAIFAKLLLTCIELLLMGMIQHISLVGSEENGEKNVSEDGECGNDAGDNSDEI